MDTKQYYTPYGTEGLKFPFSKQTSIYFKMRVDHELTFSNCFRYDLTEEFWKDISYHAKNKIKHSHRVIVTYGDTGSMKSSISILIALYQHKLRGIEFNPETNICFDNVGLVKLMQNHPKADFTTFIRDEDLIRHGEGSNALADAIQGIQETLRQKGINLIFNAPDEREIPSAHIILETLQISEDHKKVRCGWKAKNGIFLGYVIFDCTSLWDSPIWNTYQSLKESFLANIVNQEFQGVDYKGIAAEIYKEMDLKINKKKRDRKLFVYTHPKVANMTITQKEFILIALEQAIFAKNEVEKPKD